MLRDATGFHQVYGAVHAEGLVDRVLWSALKDNGHKSVVFELGLPSAESASIRSP